MLIRYSDMKEKENSVRIPALSQKPNVPDPPLPYVPVALEPPAHNSPFLQNISSFSHPFSFFFLYSHPHERSGSQKDQLISGSLKFQAHLYRDFSNIFNPSFLTEDQK
jgi:hypothetical protein